MPGGRQCFDVHRGVPSQSFLSEGVSILNPVEDPDDGLLLGLDMGEQDVRYLWGYARRGVLQPAQDHRAQYIQFRDYSWAIAWQSGTLMASLQSSTYGGHYWHKTGMYTTAGAETSQSNGNAQLLYAFIRGSAKQYGLLWYGQVSIFNWFGYKIPGDAQPSPSCKSQQDHSATCGTSLSLMKRLMYTQLAYDSVYFAFEGGWEYPHTSGHTGLTPIGQLQRQAKTLLSSSHSPDLGVHVPTVAVLLDFFSGWARPCDSAPFSYHPIAWGRIDWDAADYLADYVFELMFPGYRAGSLRHDEQGYLAPTPFGDVVDVLLSDALPSVLAQYDTIVVAHRLTSEPTETLRKLQAYVNGGGHVVITASSVRDMGGVMLNITTGACTMQPAGTIVTFPNGSAASEPNPFSFCPLQFAHASSADVLATINGQPAAIRVTGSHGGSLLLLGLGEYGLSMSAPKTPIFECTVDGQDSIDKSPHPMVVFARTLLEDALIAATLFDLGPHLSWVPRRISQGKYSLTVANSALHPVPLNIRSRIGAVARIEEVPLGPSQRNETGYLPHGYEGALDQLGQDNATQVAGVSTRVFVVTLTSDNSTTLSRPNASASLTPSRRLLRLAPGVGNVRLEILRRPSFDNHFTGVVLDWEYIEARTVDALRREAHWLTTFGIDIVVDFSSATTGFPGPLRLLDDMHLYWLDSVSRIEAVLNKMPIVHAHNAILTLHSTSELPPKNFTEKPDASFARTLGLLAAKAALANVTLHLRECRRGGDILGSTSLTSLAAFARRVPGLSVAPQFAFSRDNNQVREMLGSGQSTVVLLSAAWGSQGDGGGRLVLLDNEGRAALSRVVDMADDADALIVLDSVPAVSVNAQWNAELDDAALIARRYSGR